MCMRLWLNAIKMSSDRAEKWNVIFINWTFVPRAHHSPPRSLTPATPQTLLTGGLKEDGRWDSFKLSGL